MRRTWRACWPADLVRQISPELYATFKRSLERGRWPDGREMTAEQREHCLQAVIAYDQLRRNEPERVGYIDRGRKADSDSAERLRWAEDDVDTAPDNGTDAQGRRSLRASRRRAARLPQGGDVVDIGLFDLHPDDLLPCASESA